MNNQNWDNVNFALIKSTKRGGDASLHLQAFETEDWIPSVDAQLPTEVAEHFGFTSHETPVVIAVFEGDAKKLAIILHVIDQQTTSDSMGTFLVEYTIAVANACGLACT